MSLRSTHPPFFIVGCGRSGTTLLRVMLDAHPDLAIPPESHFIPRYGSVLQRYGSAEAFDAEKLARDIVRATRFRDWELPEQDVWRRVRALDDPGFAETVDAVFMAFAERHGKRRWGDKTPGYVLDLPLLARLFGGSRFLHVIRDGRDVAMSLREVRFGPRGAMAQARFWEHRVRAGRKHGAAIGPERYREVRYERLVEEPEAVLKEVCDFIDLDFRPDMLTYHERAATAVPARRRSQHAHVAEPPTKGLRDWRRDMPVHDVSAFEAVAGDLLHELGYERTTAKVSPSLRLRAWSGAAREALAARAWRARRAAVIRLRPDALPPPTRY